jgi:MFS transporter, putative metabolite:H+ symporter
MLMPPTLAPERLYQTVLNPTLLVVGLGYAIDAFDIFLYNALRMPSLRELGVEGDALTRTGIWILNMQVLGMLLGGFAWGILGDKIGRKKALLGSVIVYSLGSLGCAFVQDVWVYAAMRFFTGIGLAGEVGLGCILIAETLTARKRDWGICLYALFGYVGIILANILAGYISWRWCYAIGGVSGLLLLFLRMALFESALFKNLEQQKVPRGSLRLLLQNKDLLKRYLCCIFFAVPYYYIVNILVTLAPEFALAVGVATPIKAHTALLIYACCGMVGTVLATAMSRALQRRVLPIGLFMLVNIGLAAWYLLQHQPSATAFYALCGILGLANFFVLLLFTAAEQFGTNMRATAGTSALSVGRATLVLSNVGFLAFRSAGLDIIGAAAAVGGIAFTIGFICLCGLRESYHQDMDFIEQ